MRRMQQLAGVVGAAISLLSGCGPEAEVPSVSDIETTATSIADVREVDEPAPTYSLQPLNQEPSVAKAPPLTVVGPEEAVRVSFEDFDLSKLVPTVASEDEAAKQLPDWLRKLEGRRVRIRGFMSPTFGETELSSFVLTRDTARDIDQRPRVSWMIEVTLREGITTDYIQDRPFDVAGAFHLDNELETGEFYRLDDAVIISVPQSKKTR